MINIKGSLPPMHADCLIGLVVFLPHELPDWYGNYRCYHHIAPYMCNLLLYMRNVNTRVILIRQLPAAWSFADKSTLFLIHDHRLSLFNFSINRGDAFLLPLLSVDV